MKRNKQAKSHKAKSARPGGRKSRPAARKVYQSGTEVARQLDQVAHEFDGAVDGLQNSLEKLRESLPELVDLGVRRDRLRRIKALADDSILDSLQRLATALESGAATESLPESLVPLHRSARMVVDHLCRTFEVEAVHQPGELLTVAQAQVNDFDWSADHAGELGFPTDVAILRSGWKAGDAVFVLPKAVRINRIASAGSV